MMNFPGLVESELKPMLRRIVLALLVVASTAAFMLPAAQGAMDCEQVSLQAPAEGCGGEAMAGSTCPVACHLGACIAPSLAEVHPDVKVAQPFGRCGALDSDGPRAPDTAPPKHFIA